LDRWLLRAASALPYSEKKNKKIIISKIILKKQLILPKAAPASSFQIPKSKI